MYTIDIITEDENFVKRLQEYWNCHCGSQIELVYHKNWEEVHESGRITICDEKFTRNQNNLVTLVSDIQRVNEPWILAKYGKPQELYSKLVDFCKQDKKVINKELELRPVTIGRENMLELETDRNMLDSYDLGIMKNCPIEGIIPLQEYEEEQKIRYYIHGKITLREYVLKHGSDRQLLQILRDIFDILIRIEDYMLNRNHLLLDIDYIYLHQITGKPSFIYIPRENGNARWIECYQKLLTQLSEMCVAEENTNMEVMIPGTGEKLIVKQPLDYDNRTQFFTSMQIKNKEQITHKEEYVLLWKRTNQRIPINRKVFKVGKEERFVDFCIKDNPAVSRNHADFYIQENEVFLMDKGSLNHTFINGRQIPENVKVKIEKEDKITIANEEFIFSY